MCEMHKLKSGKIYIKLLRVSKLSSNAPNKNVKVLFFDQNALQFEINKNLWISPINPRPSM